MTFSNLSFWSEDEIDEREDGFLLLKNGWNTEEQPLLLHSTEVVLKSLYPSMDRNSMLTCIDEEPDSKGLMDDCSGDDAEVSETDDEKDHNKKVPPQYKPYQHLIRDTSLNDRIHSAIVDIQHCRHRIKRNQKDRSWISREEKKVRALEQQQRILNKQDKSAENSGKEEDTNDNDYEDGEIQPEHDLIRLVRTLNSIRALYPHLLPILNHPKRNDRNLRIKKTVWKQNRKPMCWILGREVFDTTTVKQCKNTHKDATLILKGYIDVTLAEKISDDVLGSTDFWQKKWIQELKKRAAPEILNPLNILAEHHDAARIETVAKQCDQDLLWKSMNQPSADIERKYRQSINQLHDRILRLLKNRFPKARLSIYGSCLSNLSLGVGADVDLSLWIPEMEKAKNGFQQGDINARTYERDTKKFVYQVFHTLKNRDKDFKNLQAITRARVPVVKGVRMLAGNPYSPDGSINFDICFLNDIAVTNSDLLREYSLVDPRARSLMMAVKKWTKDLNINSAKDNTVSSYAWINLCIFYLQCLGFVPNLQSRQLMEEVGMIADPEGNYWHYVDKLDTCTLRWSQLEKANVWKQPPEYSTTPVSVLLYGFFEFYSRRFPLALFTVSMKKGSISLPKFASHKVSLFFSIEDPFETYDSHCPHDLGTPASDDGARDIIYCLQDGEKHVREILWGNSKNPNRLWPGPNLVKPKVSKTNSEKGDSKVAVSQSTDANTNQDTSSGQTKNEQQNRKETQPKKNGKRRPNPRQRQAQNQQNAAGNKGQTKPQVGGAEASGSNQKGKGNGNPEKDEARQEKKGEARQEEKGEARQEKKGEAGKQDTGADKPPRKNRKERRRGKQRGNQKGSGDKTHSEAGKQV